MKRLNFILFIILACVRISAQDIVDNLDMFLSTKYINSNENSYIYLEISIWNRNPDTIFILKDYNLINIIEDEDGIILFLSSWISNIDFIKRTSALYHNPRMVEIRNRQNVYIPLLLQIPNEINIINKNKVVKKIDGLIYSLERYITEDISWAENVDEFVQDILNRVNALEFNYNQYTHKYGNIMINEIILPDWLIGTWMIEEEIIKIVSNDIFINDESFYGTLLNQIDNTITQNCGNNYYELNVSYENGDIMYMRFIYEYDNVTMSVGDNNESYTFSLTKIGE